MTGTSPWIVDILKGREIAYELNPHEDECGELSSETASKVISALTKFQEHQAFILGTTVRSVGGADPVRSFLKNQKSDAPSTSQRYVLKMFFFCSTSTLTRVPF